MNGGAVAIEEVSGFIPSIIEMFYPGFYGGTQIIKTLFGDINKFGKMPFTYCDSIYYL